MESSWDSATMEFRALWQRCWRALGSGTLFQRRGLIMGFPRIRSTGRSLAKEVLSGDNSNIVMIFERS